MMNYASSLIKKMLPVLRNDTFYEGMELVAAYESDIKPYPVEHPIIAFAVDSQTVGERWWMLPQTARKHSRSGAQWKPPIRSVFSCRMKAARSRHTVLRIICTGICCSVRS